MAGPCADAKKTFSNSVALTLGSGSLTLDYVVDCYVGEIEFHPRGQSAGWLVSFVVVAFYFQ